MIRDIILMLMGGIFAIVLREFLNKGLPRIKILIENIKNIFKGV